MTAPRRDRPASAWHERTVVVAGARAAGLSATRVLTGLGARVVLVDDRDDEVTRARIDALGAVTGLDVRLGAAAQQLPSDADLVVTSPGLPPHAPLLVRAAAAGVPVWGEIELAWRLRPAGAAPWLVVTGTNGKTTTVRMLAAMLGAAGLRVGVGGNIGTPLLDVVLAGSAGSPGGGVAEAAGTAVSAAAASFPGAAASLGAETPEVIAVELSSFQLHFAPSVRPLAATLLNLAPDHLDWHGSYDAYAAVKGRVFNGCEVAAVYDLADPRLEQLALAADTAAGCRLVGTTLGTPPPGALGVVEDLLVDRAFTDDPGAAIELAELGDITPFAPHTVSDALAAAALARAAGVPPEAVRAGLRAFRPDPHRIAAVGTFGGVTYVDDSKATNPHAAAASLAAYASVVWIAGGLAKGATFDDLVRGAAARLRGVVLLGADRDLIAQALARHAPEVPVVEVLATQTGAMDAVVAAAARLATPGDTVLLAPACASMDMFTDYGARGDAFSASARQLRSQPATQLDNQPPNARSGTRSGSRSGSGPHTGPHTRLDTGPDTGPGRLP